MMASPMLVVAAMPTVPIAVLVPPAVTVKLVLNSNLVMMAIPTLAVAAMPTAPMPVLVLPAAMVRLVPN